MRLYPLAFALVACASHPPPPPTPPPEPPPRTVPTAARHLTTDECDSLSKWIVDVCHDRASLRSAQVDGWCGDVERRTTVDDRSWVDECAAHVTYIDNECFRSTRSISHLMDCDSTVSR